MPIRRLSSTYESTNKDEPLKCAPMRITKQVLERDFKQMEDLVMRNAEDENDEETNQRIERIYNTSKTLLNRYYLMEEKKEPVLNYKDIVLLQQLMQRSDNLETMEGWMNSKKV